MLVFYLQIQHLNPIGDNRKCGKHFSSTTIFNVFEHKCQYLSVREWGRNTTNCEQLEVGGITKSYSRWPKKVQGIVCVTYRPSINLGNTRLDRIKVDCINRWTFRWIVGWENSCHVFSVLLIAFHVWQNLSLKSRAASTTRPQTQSLLYNRN